MAAKVSLQCIKIAIEIRTVHFVKQKHFEMFLFTMVIEHNNSSQAKI